MHKPTVTNAIHLDRAARHAAARINFRAPWFDVMVDLTNEPTKKRALRSWLKKGDKLNTLQITLTFDEHDEPTLVNAWSPGPRTVAHEGPTYITWDTGSRAEIKGMSALTSTEDAWIGGYEWGTGRLVLVVYVRTHEDPYEA